MRVSREIGRCCLNYHGGFPKAAERQQTRAPKRSDFLKVNGHGVLLPHGRLKSQRLAIAEVPWRQLSIRQGIPGLAKEGFSNSERNFSFSVRLSSWLEVDFFLLQGGLPRFRSEHWPASWVLPALFPEHRASSILHRLL